MFLPFGFFKHVRMRVSDGNELLPQYQSKMHSHLHPSQPFAGVQAHTGTYHAAGLVSDRPDNAKRKDSIFCMYSVAIAVALSDKHAP